MIAFHGDAKIKARYLRRVRQHAAADQIVKGQYWEDGKGCAVGCTLHGSNHHDYETELGIPEMLARLEDMIFEGLPNGTAKGFPARFLGAAKPGADLSRVGWQFLHWLLTEELVGRDHPTVKIAIEQCAAVLVPPINGLPINQGASAARAARAARVATWAARAAVAGEAAWAATAARAAAAGEAGEAARVATWAARVAAAGEAAGKAVKTCHVRMADKLIKLMKAA